MSRNGGAVRREEFAAPRDNLLISCAISCQECALACSALSLCFPLHPLFLSPSLLSRLSTPLCIGILRSLVLSPSFCLPFSQVLCHFIFMFSSCARSFPLSPALSPAHSPFYLCHIYHGSLLWRPGAEVFQPGRCISQLSKSCTQSNNNKSS